MSPSAPIPTRPDPFLMEASCAICGKGHTAGGIERRRIGWRPWRRLVHVECINDAVHTTDQE